MENNASHAKPARTPSKSSHTMLTFACVLLLAYLAVAGLLFTTQPSFLYPAPQGEAHVPAGFDQIAYQTADGLQLQAGYRPAQAGKPTIVYFHGNAADWQSSVVATERLTPAGYGVLAAEYRGYRDNPGKPTEEGLYKDGRAALAWLAERGIGAQDTVLIGNSIGSGVATQMALEHSSRALVLISPFASLTQLVSEKLKILPVSFLLRDHYRNDEKLVEMGGPILILHGTADTLIPVNHARQLAQGDDNVQLIEFDGVGHDLAWHDAAEQAVLTFLTSAAPPEGNE